MPDREPRVLSERTGKWILTLYPPLLFQRVRVLEVGRGFRSARVRVSRSLLTRNLNGTTFGGSIFSAADPIYPVLYWQALARRGERVQVWLKGAAVEYLKPAASDLLLEFAVSEADLDQASSALRRDGRFARTHLVRALDDGGLACAEIRTEVYVRRPREGQRELSGF
jgi:acyl-coenzyme A thioesterase PaaI-like protein